MQTIEIIIPGEPIAPRRKRGEVRHGRIAADPSSPIGCVLAGVRVQAPEALLADWVHLEVVAHVVPPKRASRRIRAAMLAGEVTPTGRPGLNALVEFWSDILGQVVYLDGCQVRSAFVERRYAEEPRTVVRVREVRRH